MSRLNSTVITIKCDWSDCDKEYIHVGLIEDEDLREWLEIKAFGKNWDLCSDHMAELEKILNVPPMQTLITEDMEPDIGDSRE